MERRGIGTWLRQQNQAFQKKTAVHFVWPASSQGRTKDKQTHKQTNNLSQRKFSFLFEELPFFYFLFVFVFRWGKKFTKKKKLPSLSGHDLHHAVGLFSCCQYFQWVPFCCCCLIACWYVLFYFYFILFRLSLLYECTGNEVANRLPFPFVLIAPSVMVIYCSFMSFKKNFVELLLL